MATRHAGTVLTIAGSDSSAGAGIQADLQTFAAHGVYATTAVTAVTAQGPTGVTAVHAVPADVITAQIDAAFERGPVTAAKIGMIGGLDALDAILAAIRAHDIHPVVDPVLVASSGAPLLAEEAYTRFTNELVPRAVVVTPNWPEAERLSGAPIRSLDDAREAARRIHAGGPAAVVVTGGHQPDTEAAVDIVYDGDELVDITTPRVAVPPPRTHGTGCSYSAALVARLARGERLVDAARGAQDFVADALRRSDKFGLLYCQKWEG